MPITKQKKEEIVGKLQENLKKSKFTVFVNFHGLNVAAVSELRSLLRKAEASYYVAKKTLIKRVLDELKFSGDIPELEGETALAFAETDTAMAESAKILKDFAKKNEMKLLGGIFESKFIDDKSVVMIASIPPREVLLGQFVNVINSPIQGMVGTLSGVMGNFARVLGEVAKKK